MKMILLTSVSIMTPSIGHIKDILVNSVPKAVSHISQSNAIIAGRFLHLSEINGGERNVNYFTSKNKQIMSYQSP